MLILNHKGQDKGPKELQMDYNELIFKIDLWVSRAIQAHKTHDSAGLACALNIARGYKIKLDKLLDQPIRR